MGSPAVTYLREVRDGQWTTRHISRNAMRLFGYEAAEPFAPDGWAYAIHPEEREHIGSLIQQALESHGRGAADLGFDGFAPDLTKIHAAVIEPRLALP